MSEPIAKVCPTCNDTNKVHSDAWVAPPAPCPDCRVPDVESTLRAEVARLTAELTTLREQAESCHDDVAWVEGLADMQGIVLEGNIEELTSENTRLTAEVERLEGREREAYDLLAAECYWCGCEIDVRHKHIDDCPRAAWLAGCKP